MIVQSLALLTHHFRVVCADQDPILRPDGTQTELEIGGSPAIWTVQGPIDSRFVTRLHWIVPLDHHILGTRRYRTRVVYSLYPGKPLRSTASSIKIRTMRRTMTKGKSASRFTIRERAACRAGRGRLRRTSDGANLRLTSAVSICHSCDIRWKLSLPPETADSRGAASAFDL